MDVFNRCSFRLRKKINKLLSKGMPNIYLKITIEKNYYYWRSQNFDFLDFRNLSPASFWVAETHADIIEF